MTFYCVLCLVFSVKFCVFNVKLEMFVCCLIGQDSLEKEILNLNENIPGKIKVNKKNNNNNIIK